MKVFSNFIQDMLMPQIIDFDTTYWKNRREKHWRDLTRM